MKALVISLFLQTNGIEALRTQAGVMRVDLERQLVQRPEQDEEQILLKDMDNADSLSYSQLRNLQNFHIRQSFAQVSNKSKKQAAPVLEIEDIEIEIKGLSNAMETPISDEENILTSAGEASQIGADATQLVSEFGLADEDVGEDLQL